MCSLFIYIHYNLLILVIIEVIALSIFTSETLEAFLIKDPNNIPLSEKGKNLLRNSHIYNIDK